MVQGYSKNFIAFGGLEDHAVAIENEIWPIENFTDEEAFTTLYFVHRSRGVSTSSFATIFCLLTVILGFINPIASFATLIIGNIVFFYMRSSFHSIPPRYRRAYRLLKKSRKEDESI